MALPLFSQEENLAEKLGRRLGTGLQQNTGFGLGGGLQQLAQSNLDRMLGRQNYFQQNVNQLLKDLGIPTQEAPTSLMTPEYTSNTPVSAKDVQELKKKSTAQIPALTAKEQQEKKKLESAQEKLKKQQTKEERTEQHLINKETQPFYDEVSGEAKAAKNNLKRLDRMEKLSKEGNLGIPAFNALLRTVSKGIFGLGIDLSSLMTADAQEFEKLSTDFLRDAKKIFGSRITDADLNAFLRTVPSLAQSREGQLRIIHNMRQANRASELRNNIMNDIIRQNDGKRPANLQLLVEEKADPQLNALAEEFEKTRPADMRPTSILGNIPRLGEGLLWY